MCVCVFVFFFFSSLLFGFETAVASSSDQVSDGSQCEKHVTTFTGQWGKVL